MSKDEKRQRQAVIARMNALNDREEEGEDVTAERLACGKELDAIGRKKPRVNVMDADLIGKGYEQREARKRYKVTESEKPKMKKYEDLKAKGLDDTEIAKQLGVSYHMVKKIRRHSLVADESKAYRKWKKVAAENNIKPNTYATRIRKGWDYKEAATYQPFETVLCPYRLKAEENDIPAEVYHSRVGRGWTKEEASTIPRGMHKSTYYTLEAMK